MDLNKDINDLYKVLEDMNRQEKAIRTILYDDKLSAVDKIEQIRAIATIEQMEQNRSFLEGANRLKKWVEEE